MKRTVFSKSGIIKRSFFILAILAILLSNSALQPASALMNSNYPDGPNVIPLLNLNWITGSIYEGDSHILAKDLNNDGITEIVACSLGYVYSMVYQNDTYIPTWYSQYVACGKVASGDRNQDGIAEIYVATQDSRIIIFDASSHSLLGTINLPINGMGNVDIAVGDIDNDNELEIIDLRPNDLSVYDANTLTLEWRSTDFHGGDVRIANIDTDPLPEIIVTGMGIAWVINGITRTEKWEYQGGFGFDFWPGDIDHDGMAEIVYITDTSVNVFEGDTQTKGWAITGLFDVDGLFVADVNHDGVDEVITGDGQWGYIHILRGDNGQEITKIPNPGSGFNEISSGDVNNDGVIEILGGPAGAAYPFIASWVTQTILWQSEVLDSPYHVVTGDIENDGDVEIVMASHRTNSGYDNPTIRVFAGETHLIKWSSEANLSMGLSQLVLGQMDSDPALEILVGGNSDYHSRVIAYDGLTHAVDWQSPDLEGNWPRALLAADIDNDGIDEAIIGSESNVLVYKIQSDISLWDSGSLLGTIRDMAIGDLNADSIQDLVILTTSGVYIYRVDTWQQELYQPLSKGMQAAILGKGAFLPGELLLVTSDYDGTHASMQAWDGISSSVKWSHPLGDVFIDDLVVNDFDSDGKQEFLLAGGSAQNTPIINFQSFLGIGNNDFSKFWEYIDRPYWGNLNSIALYDGDNDGKQELVVGSDYHVMEYDIEPLNHFVFLPLMSDLPYWGIYGTITQKGTPVSGVSVDLLKCDTSSCSVVATELTDSTGLYSFKGLSGLVAGESYSVRYLNIENDASRVYLWYTPMVHSYIPNSNYHLSDFDIADITLVYPSGGNYYGLPLTFNWKLRSSTPTDNYELVLFDPNNSAILFYTDPPLGYVNTYTLNHIPPGFAIHQWYIWEMIANAPDGGFGVSYYVRVVGFGGPGAASISKLPADFDRRIFDEWYAHLLK
jgi:hypothetical protein